MHKLILFEEHYRGIKELKNPGSLEICYCADISANMYAYSCTYTEP